MANPAPRSGRLCDAGLHWMDPNWENCPYCNAEKRSKEQTQAGQPYAPVSASADERRTKTGDVPLGSRRETKTMPSGLSPGAGVKGGEVDTRRIVGVMVTYTWRPEGQLFLVREGKNFIGAGNVSSDTSHRLSDILIRNDPRLSAEHALILCRHGRYDIVDQESTNGTFLNGELVPLQGTELPNYAEIKTGSTVWTFIKITPPAAEVAEVIQHPAEPKAEEPTVVVKRPDKPTDVG